jgi:hypothetical protein
MPRLNQPAALPSLEIHADRTVAFGCAPSVEPPLNGDHALAKASDGSWSVTKNAVGSYKIDYE